MMTTKGKAALGILACVGAVCVSDPGTHAQARRDGLTSATHRELAAARSATAKYHDVAQAEADGYVDIGLYEPGEGFHWFNASLVDGTFDPAKPEILLYALVPGESRLQLIAVEYVVPVNLPVPAGFAGQADRWREDVEEFNLWELTAWIWEHNPDGMFAHLNPRIP
jgi:hypothetical protein